MLSDLDIIKVYYTMFGRAPDLEGFNYWKQEAGSRSWDMADLVNRFLELPVVHQAGYEPQQSAGDYIANLYATLFGKTPDDGGYWEGRLAQGLSRGDLLDQMVQAAQGTPEGTPGKDTLLNKLSFSQYMVDFQAANGISLDAGNLADWTARVGPEDHSVVQAVESLKTELENLLGRPMQYQFAPTVQNPGQDPLYDSLQTRITALVDSLDQTFFPGGTTPDGEQAAFAGLLPALQQQGTLEFSESIWASMRDAGADLDRDGQVEFGGESLYQNSLTLTGLDYLLQAASRTTEADISHLEAIYEQFGDALANPAEIYRAAGEVADFLNEISTRFEQQVPITPDIQNSMAESYLEIIGTVKQMIDTQGANIIML